MDRFWAKVRRAGPDDCWLWTAYADRYGCFRFNGRVAKAHRVAWELTNGPVPSGLCVLHRCDNPACVNPGHLFLGTDADNVRDRNQKGRQARGQAHGHYTSPRRGNRKLLPIQAREIRRRLLHGERAADLAREFRVTPCTISDIKMGRTWPLEQIVIEDGALAAPEELQPAEAGS